MSSSAAAGEQDAEDAASALEQQQHIQTLTAMGFDRQESSQALFVCNGNIEAAANFLLGGGIGSGGMMGAASTTATASTSSNDDHANTNNCTMMISAPISQYKYDDGRSACTCISLELASSFLQRQTQQASSGDDHQQATTAIITPEWIQSCIEKGVEKYRYVKLQQKQRTDVEHLSAEQCYKYYNENLKLIGGGDNTIRQGILTRDPTHPQGLSRLLYECLQQTTAVDTNNNSWTCVVITKTPETVLVCLPPPSLQQQQQNSDNNSQNNNYNYILLDTHPRPHVWPNDGAQQAYARKCKTMEDLLSSLMAIFPIVNLGDGVPDLMEAMYNSFDLYVFQYNKMK